jgi:glycosyltransferase involved in cell wall biosynthesis
MKGKLLIIGERFYPEEFLINDVVETLQSQGFEITVITQQPSYPYGKIYDGYTNSLFGIDNFHGAKIIRTGFVKGYNQSVLRKILNYLAFVILGIWAVLFKASKPDNILIYQTGPLSQAIIGIVAKWRFRKPLHIWTWDVWPDSVYAYGFKQTGFLSWTLNKFVTWVYRSCDKILVSSPGFTKVINKYAPNHICEVIPNWITETVANGGDTTIDMPKGFNYTFTGNIGKVQNLDNILKGFSLAVTKDNSIYLHLVGDGSFVPDLKKIVADLKIPNVIFWGRRPSKDMAAFYQASHALIISLNAGSVWELYIPSKFQTYLGAQKPIFAAIGGSVRELVEKNQLGICADPQNIEEIAKAFSILKSISNDQTQTIKRNSSQLLAQYFDRKQNLSKLANLFSKKRS